MNSASDILTNSQMTRNKVRVKDIEILSAASLISTDIFVYTQFGDTYKWQLENRDPRKLIPVRIFNINCNPAPLGVRSSVSVKLMN